jgi:hypothetical protein
MIAIRNVERNRRAERRAVPQTGSYLNAIVFDLLPRTSAIPCLPPRKLRINPLARDA